MRSAGRGLPPGERVRKEMETLVRGAPDEYRFLTRWQFDAPIERVWAMITDVERYPEWWPGVKSATVKGPDRALRVGQIADMAVRGSLPYTLHFRTEVVEFTAPERLALRATGELIGRGEWNLTPAAGGTAVTYLWEVRLSKLGFGLLTRVPGIRRLLARNHDTVMAEGHANLTRLLAGSEP
jgi:uncharacterized protein YndB with AHSA1/START domain